jgi:hypothetical protein
LLIIYHITKVFWSGYVEPLVDVILFRVF